MRKFGSILMIVAGVLAALMGIWIWIAPDVLDYVVAIVLFFGGLFIIGRGAGIRRA